MKNIGIICVIGAAILMVAAVILRLTDISIFLAAPVRGLWKAGILLSLISIAYGVNKQ